LSKPNLLSPKDFDRLFTMALTDTKFRQDLGKRGLVALENKGFDLNIPKKTRELLDKTLRPVGPVAGGECGVCAVCIICVGCGGGNAAAWVAGVTQVIRLGATTKPGGFTFPRKPGDLGLPGVNPPKL